MTEFLVPAGYGEAELTEKRSRFIARVWHTETEAAATAHVKDMREQHWDAAHNVYAYILKTGGIMRYSDDGEPQGTSGMPVLDVFCGGGIFDVCCVVTRYFGGVLLGTGGLVRAYSAAAKLALAAAGTGVMGLWVKLLISCTYSQFAPIRAVLEEMGAMIESTDFSADVVIDTAIPVEREDALRKRLTELTAGTVEPLRSGEEMRAQRQASGGREESRVLKKGFMN